MSLRLKDIVAAVVHRGNGDFFLCFNERWKQYALPMKELEPGVDTRAVAIDAFTEDCPDLAIGATASPLEYLGGYGTSWGPTRAHTITSTCSKCPYRRSQPCPPDLWLMRADSCLIPP